MSASWPVRFSVLHRCAVHSFQQSFWDRCTRVWLQRLCSTSPGKVLSLCDRGVLQTVFPEGSVADLSKHLAKPRTVYCGFDPTSDSLHIGNLVAVIALLHCQRAGHTPVALIGGATALIGDPSGKTTERAPMSWADVQSNANKLEDSVNQIVSNYANHIHRTTDGPIPPFKVLNNMEWYQGLRLVDFMSTTGRHFRMGPMLAKRSVQSRMNSPEGMSFTEFTYQVFQAYDWLHLHQEHQCTIQVGGNDQLGNLVAGYELISKVSKQPVYGLTVPLVTTSTGDKLGKTAGNAVWLDPQKLSPFHFYQYFINVTDADVEKYLKLFTFLQDEEIASVLQEQHAFPEKRTAQKRLAKEVTLLVHGDLNLRAAELYTKLLYGGSIEEMASLQPEELDRLFGQMPVQNMQLHCDMTVLNLCMNAGCFGRIEDARRIIKAGGVYLNSRRVTQPDSTLVPGEHILGNNLTLIRIGKKHHYVIRWSR